MNADNTGWLIKLLGQDKIQGGFEQLPDGTIRFNPYSGSKGFLGGASRKQAAMLNQEALLPLLRLQQEMAAQKEIEGMRGTNQLEQVNRRIAGDREIEALRGQNTIRNTRVGGRQERKTQQQKSLLDEWAAQKGQQRTRQLNRQQSNFKIREGDAAMLNKQGFRNTPEQTDLYDNNQRINAANMGQRSALEQLILRDPEFMKALTLGMTQQAMSPAFENAQKGKIDVGAGGAAAVPKIPGVEYMTAIGGGAEEQNIPMSIEGTTIPSRQNQRMFRPGTITGINVQKELEEFLKAKAKMEADRNSMSNPTNSFFRSINPGF